MCWEMGWRGLSTVSVCDSAIVVSSRFPHSIPAVHQAQRTAALRSVSAIASDMHVAAAVVAYLALDMPKIDPQFLQQWRLPVISLCSKCRYPACSQSPLLSHAPTDALPAETGRRAKSAGAWVGL